MPDTALLMLIIVIVLGLGFDYINGFHDTANAIATSVATRVLSPGRAVAMAAGLNFVGALTGTACSDHGRQRHHRSLADLAIAGSRRAPLG